MVPSAKRIGRTETQSDSKKVDGVGKLHCEYF
jgi:hypothetical protein